MDKQLHANLVARPTSRSTTPSLSSKLSKTTEQEDTTTNEDGRSEEFEFGGSLGNAALIIGFPLLMWYMWIGATYYDGQLPWPTSNQSTSDFLHHLAHLVYEGAYPTTKAWAIYGIFFIFEALMYVYMPGMHTQGKPLPHENGKRLPYYCSAYTSFYATLVVAAILHVTRIFPLTNVIDHFGSIMTVAIISGFALSFFFYFSALATGRTHRPTGYPVYDFFMGAELNPRLGIIDWKMFFEVRIPWFILILVTLSVAAKQYDEYGTVSGEVIFLAGAHYLYANACAKGEQLIVTSWDMYSENLGFMLTFWNLAGVPFTYSQSALFLARQNPTLASRFPSFFLSALAILYLFMYWMWDTSNSQKNAFRQQDRARRNGGDPLAYRELVDRKTFPQLPWRIIENPKTIKVGDGSGDRILCDGWFGIVRKPNYVPDMFFALCWGLICGFSSSLPWFYPVFFAVMIVHRTLRDVEKCRRKYGEAWIRYEKEVPWLFIPYVL